MDAILKAASNVGFLPILLAAINYYQGNINDPGSGINNQPGDLILGQYDFIIVGAGSAGENNIPTLK